MTGVVALLWTLVGRFAVLSLGVVVGALVNRALTPGGRGVYAEVQTWVGLYATLFGCSLDTAIYHFANRQRYPVSDGVRLSLAFLSTTFVAIVGLLAMWGTMEVAPHRFSEASRTHFTLVALLLGATVLGNNLVTLVQALAHVRFAAILGLIQGTLGALLIGGAFVTHRISVWYALTTTTIGQIVVTMLVLFSLGSRDGFSLAGLDRHALRSYFAAGLKQHVATVSTFVYVRVNQLIVFHYCGDTQTGWLAASLTLAFGLFSGFSALQFALYPRVIHSTDDFDVTIRSLRLSFFVGLVVVVPLVACARLILHAYGGAAFEPAAESFRLLVPAAWFMSMSALIAPYYTKLGAFGLASGSAVILGIVSVVSNLLLVPAHAANGAAASTLVTTTIGFAMILGMLRLMSGRSPLALFRPKFGVEVAAARRLLQSLRGMLHSAAEH